MKLEVPYFKQTSKMNCGPTALKMVLAFFGDNKDIEQLENACESNDGKGVTTIKLAIGAAKLGYNTKFYSKSLFFNEELLKLDFYKNYGDVNSIEASKLLVEKAKNLGVLLEEREIELDVILMMLKNNNLAIVLLDWNVVNGTPEKGYSGHFVPIVGFDEKNIYVHNQGFNHPTPSLAIPIETFEKARKANGTDEDIVFIRNKSTLKL